ncbi:MAG: saccharopine dehydrogenase NADP-binding domain-containing protein, partial [Pseudomonadota bacterium]|nr:saccharopine dehydrogenase NADP-binding domain-containing protein [Pseudomonadota bacterium]
AARAKALGLDFEIAGRNRQTLAALADALAVSFRVFDVDGAANGGAEQSLTGVDVLLNFAGPFAQTAEPLMRACLEAGVDYLDITAEINVYRLAERLVAFHSFGSWKDSLFGDLHAYGLDAVRFYTRRKAISQRWPQRSAQETAQFSFPSS